MTVIPTKWATVRVEYAEYNRMPKGRLECCDNESFTLHQTELAALNWAAANISADKMVAVLRVERLFAAQAIELKDADAITP